MTPKFPEGSYHGAIEVAVRGPGAGGRPDFAAVAAHLGVAEVELMNAFGTSKPPDFAAAAQALEISKDELRAAMSGLGQEGSNPG